MRLLLILLMLVAAAVTGTDAAAQDRLNGRYFGADDATGAIIDIRPSDEGYTGTFYDLNGKSEDFVAEAIGDAAETELFMDQRVVLMRIAPLPYGAQVSLVPYGPDGKLVLEAGRSLGFIREGVRLPEFPADYLSPPRADCRRVAAYSFMVSYEFWPPSGVMYGYNCLPERARTLMRFFPAVKLDVVWKICLAPDNRAALANALRNTGLECAQVIEAVADIQRRDRFDRYKAEVAEERKILSMVMRCAEGYPESKANCERASRQTEGLRPVAAYTDHGAEGVALSPDRCSPATAEVSACFRTSSAGVNMTQQVTALPRLRRNIFRVLLNGHPVRSKIFFGIHVLGFVKHVASLLAGRHVGLVLSRRAIVQQACGTQFLDARQVSR